MATFEEVGKVMGREMEKLRAFFEAELRPTTQRQLVSALRTASKQLEDLAEKLAARDARSGSGGGSP